VARQVRLRWDDILSSHRAGDTVPLALIAVQPDGQPVAEPVKVHVTAQQVEWQTLRKEKAGGVAGDQSEPELTALAGMDVSRCRLVQVGDEWQPDGDAAPPTSNRSVTAGGALAVTLLRGATDCPKEPKVPEYRLGYCQLPVERPDQKLEVNVEAGANEYRPGERIHVTAAVADSAGRGLGASQGPGRAVVKGPTGHAPGGSQRVR